jgi:hypothetical protein
MGKSDSNNSGTRNCEVAYYGQILKEEEKTPFLLIIRFLTSSGRLQVFKDSPSPPLVLDVARVEPDGSPTVQDKAHPL